MQELVGKHFTVVVPEEYKQLLCELHDEFFINQKEINGEWQVLNKHGETLTIIANAAYIVGEDSRPKKVTFIVDITERIKAEIKLSEYAKELEGKSKELRLAYDKIQKNVEKAHRVQRQFFPDKLPLSLDMMLAAYYKPAEQLGGDYYNIIKLNDDELVIYLSDVSGHGIDGALLNVFVKNTLDIFISDKNANGIAISPKDAINFLSKRYQEENLDGDYFICLCLGVLHTKKGTFTFCSAGFQTPMLLVDPNGKCDHVSLGGLPISNIIPFDLIHREDKTITLHAGMTFLITTDGLIEEENSEGEMFGIGRVEKVFVDNHHVPPQFIQKNLIKAFNSFKVTNENTDDITMMMVQRVPEAVQMKKIVIPSSFEKLDEIRSQISEILQNKVNINEFLMYTLEIVNNCIEHGNKFIFNKNISILIATNENYILTLIEDEGDGFDWKVKVLKPLDIEKFSSRGLGIQLTKLYFDSIFFNDKGNQVSLLKQIK